MCYTFGEVDVHPFFSRSLVPVVMHALLVRVETRLCDESVLVRVMDLQS
jgi:hypothetical protein